MDPMEPALSYAARNLGVSSLNEHQKAAVMAIVGGKDVFVCLPTGYGKSLCFQCSVSKRLSVETRFTCRQAPSDRS